MAGQKENRRAARRGRRQEAARLANRQSLAYERRKLQEAGLPVEWTGMSKKQLDRKMAQLVAERDRADVRVAKASADLAMFKMMKEKVESEAAEADPDAVRRAGETDGGAERRDRLDEHVRGRDVE